MTSKDICNKALARIQDETMYDHCNRQYLYRAFRADEQTILQWPVFQWKQHIDQTFYDCMSGVMDRFLEVV